MKKFFVFLVLGIFLVLFQSSFLPRLFPLVLRPNLLLIVLVYLSMSGGSVWHTFWAACMGLFFDTLSGGPFGLFFFIFVALYAILKGVNKLLLLKSPVFQAGAVLLAHFLQGVLLITILVLLGLPFPGESSYFGQLLVCSLIGAFLSPPFFGLFERIDCLPGLSGFD
jgi:rod shape-determining protein MreD